MYNVQFSMLNNQFAFGASQARGLRYVQSVFSDYDVASPTLAEEEVP